MSEIQYQCPFCERGSLLAQGLAAHIRNQHSKHYPKWLQTPTRLEDARQDGRATMSSPSILIGSSPVPSDTTRPASPTETRSADFLLTQARAQLKDRKQVIEAELCKLTELTQEQQRLNAQIGALEQTLAVFDK